MRQRSEAATAATSAQLSQIKRNESEWIIRRSVVCAYFTFTVTTEETDESEVIFGKYKTGSTARLCKNFFVARPERERERYRVVQIVFPSGPTNHTVRRPCTALSRISRDLYTYIISRNSPHICSINLCVGSASTRLWILCCMRLWCVDCTSSRLCVGRLWAANISRWPSSVSRSSDSSYQRTN